MRLIFFVLSSFPLVFAAGPLPYDRKAPINPKVVWHDCPADTKPGLECGQFDVPLDYADSSVGKATLAVVRFQSTGPAGERLGTLFLNPGGPGESGVDMVLGAGASLAKTYAEGYNLVSWDPRGVGLTYPRIGCFDSPEDQNSFSAGTAFSGIEVRGNFTNEDDTDPDVIAFWKQEAQTDRVLEQLGQRCLERNGDNLMYVGTAATVRDMVALSDALEGPDKDINVWGFSYGTVIVTYFVNMFPDRVGRVIADAVVDVLAWATLPSHKIIANGFIDADELFRGFAGACALAGPQACALAKYGGTEESIVKWTQDLLDATYDAKVKDPSSDVGSAQLRLHIHQAMYQPKTWQALAKELSDFEAAITSSNTTSGLRRRAADAQMADFALAAITCADAIDAGDVTTKDVFQTVVNVSRNVSHMFGPTFLIAGLWCHKWPARAVERFTGPFDSKLKTPILIIGNELDPITPFAGAETLNTLLGDDAILIQQDDFGHCSTATHSECTVSIVKEFFSTGAYPVERHLCAVDTNLFPSPPITKGSIAAAKLSVLASDEHGSAAGTGTGIGFSVSDAKNEIEYLKTSRLILAIMTGVLSFAFLLTSLAFVFTCLRGQRTIGKAKTSGLQENTDSRPLTNYTYSKGEEDSQYKD